MSDMNKVEVSFVDCASDEALLFANDLENDLRVTGNIDVSRKKDRVDSQDFGSTLVLVFGTPVAIALARAISTFLQRQSGAKIRITKSGEVVATNLDSRDVSRIVEALAGKASK
jgi:hypothetical protein